MTGVRPTYRCSTKRPSCSATTAPRRRAERAARARAIAYAQGSLDVLSGSGSTDFDDDDESEILTAKDILDAEMLAERYEADDDRTLADRAAADRRWTYGHVIVDEAQELTPMAWRAIARRCPLRSMTVVGDVAQTGAIGGGTSWAAALGETFGDRWRLAELTLNYRTPAEVMELAGDVLREVDPSRAGTALGPVDRREALARGRSRRRAGRCTSTRSPPRRRSTDRSASSRPAAGSSSSRRRSPTSPASRS